MRSGIRALPEITRSYTVAGVKLHSLDNDHHVEAQAGIVQPSSASRYTYTHSSQQRGPSSATALDMGLDASPVAPPMRPQTMVNSRRHGTIRDQRHYGHVGGLESKSTGPTMEQYFKKTHVQSTYSGTLALSIILWADMRRRKRP